MQLPDFPPLPADFPRKIAVRHGLRIGGLSRLADLGIFNAIYLLGSRYVLRVPRDAPPFVGAIGKESVAVPAARAAGVRTPALVAFDDSLEILPVPYAIYERVRGDTLGLLDLRTKDTPAVWDEVGRDLARLHEGVSEDGPTAGLEPELRPDPRSLPDELASAGYFTSLEARWLSGWLERLAPVALAPLASRFLHGDLQTTNVMFGTQKGGPPFAAIDWEDVSVGPGAADVAWFVVGGLSMADRRERERELLEGYHRTLVGHGVPEYPFERLWEDYRTALLDRFVQAVLMAASPSVFTRRRRFGRALAERFIAASEDHRLIEGLRS